MRRSVLVSLPIEIADRAPIERLGGEGATLTITLVNAAGKETLKKLLAFR